MQFKNFESCTRLGLYVFCRKQLFSHVRELLPTFNLLNSRPSQLQLVPDERCPPTRPIGTSVAQQRLVSVNDVQHMGQIVLDMSATVRANLISSLEAHFEEVKRLEYEKRRVEQAKLAEAKRREAEAESKELDSVTPAPIAIAVGDTEQVEGAIEEAPIILDAQDDDDEAMMV